MCTTMPGRVEGGDLLNRIEVMQLVYMTIKNGWLNYTCSAVKFKRSNIPNHLLSQ